MTSSSIAPVHPTPRSSRVRALAQAAVLGLLVSGVAGWTLFDRTVTLQVDGRSQQVRILGSEVDDVLAAAAVEVGARDLVSPAQGETVADGGQVVVRYARRLTVADPAGGERSFWTTELRVDDALAAAGLRHEDAWLSTSRSARIGRDGLALTLSTPKDVTVVADGQARAVSSPGPTVADLFAELGLVLDGDDRTDVAPETVLTTGQTVTVRRVQVEDVVTTEPVPRGERTVEDDELFTDEDEVREEGADGEQAVTWRVVLVDGQEESRTELERRTTVEPVERVVAAGTQDRPEPAAGPVPVAGADADGLNWGALAACESGGNPTIVSRNGLYHGLYQFSSGTWRSVGGAGDASSAPPEEQTARAKALYSRSGAGQWPSCGPRLFS